MLLHRVFNKICAKDLAHSRIFQFRSMSLAAHSSAAIERPYKLTPLPAFGMEVHGIDLKNPVSDEVVELIKEDVTK
jgi:hypothetical protein